MVWSVPVKLQHVQNSTTQNVTTTKCSNHVTPILTDLNWLLVKYLIQYKVAVIVYHVLTTQEPSCLTDVMRLHVPSYYL